MNNLTAGLEDYLELIFKLTNENKIVRAVELSKILKVSRASVSEALNKLSDKKLIVNDRYKGIFITEDGVKKAKDVISKHNTFKAFFENILGLDNSEAEFNACKIEHFISETALERINQFQQYCNKNLDFVNDFKTEYRIKN